MLVLGKEVIFAALIVGACFCSSFSYAWMDAAGVVQKLPKVELHAHLHGSIRLSTLDELSIAAGAGPLKVTVSEEHSGQVEKPFELFPLIHKVVTTKEIALRILREMIEDFEAENVVYLEIRTTPRPLPDGTTASEYVRELTKAIHAHNDQPQRKMLVKLILSVDRGRSFQEGLQVVNLLKEHAVLVDPVTQATEKIIVGVDFSGNPLGGKFPEFQPIFDQVRQLGFNITLHTAEAEELTDEAAYDETDAILDFAPDRAGHMLYLHERHLQKIFELKQAGKAIMVEICPSTSLFVLHLRSYADHPYIRKFHSMHHPISLNTDDTAIFNTTLTKEILHMMVALDWQPRDIALMEARALAHLFATPDEVQTVRDRFWSVLSSLQADEASALQQQEQEQEEHGNHHNRPKGWLDGIAREAVESSNDLAAADSLETIRGRLIASSLEVF